MLNELEEMICFAAVCDAGTMTAAAKKLNRSKAHVSKKIANLESRIGITLLHKTTRKITVTDAGSRFKDTAPTSIFWFVLSPVMAELQEILPDVDFELIPSNKPIDLVSEGIDLAIRIGNVVGERLIAHQVGVGRDVLFTSALKNKNLKQFTEITDVMNERLILNPYSYDGEMLRLTCSEQNIELRVSEYPLLINLVKRGCGVGFAPNYSISKMIEKGDLVPIMPNWHGREWPVFVVYPFAAPIPNKLQKISSFLREKLSKKITF